MIYKILLVSLAAGLIAQVAKFFIKTNEEKFNYKKIFAYSGMPSGHSAMVVALAAIIGLKEGFSSPLFALAFIFALVVIRDALGIRRYLGQHGKILNILVKDLEDDSLLNEHYPHLLEKIGHTPAQVIVGGVIGLLTALAGYLL